jgi:hypothetical protein
MTSKQMKGAVNEDEVTPLLTASTATASAAQQGQG